MYSTLQSCRQFFCLLYVWLQLKTVVLVLEDVFFILISCRYGCFCFCSCNSFLWVLVSITVFGKFVTSVWLQLATEPVVIVIISCFTSSLQLKAFNWFLYPFLFCYPLIKNLWIICEYVLGVLLLITTFLALLSYLYHGHFTVQMFSQ